MPYMSSIVLLFFFFFLQRKVNPELPVEIKPSNRTRKLQESKLKKQRTMLKRQQDDDELWHVERRSGRFENILFLNADVPDGLTVRYPSAIRCEASYKRSVIRLLR